MKITAQEEYGLRCLIRLAKAGNSRSLTIPEIASAEGLSVPYAGKLLAVLRQAGLIASARGRSGGYRLARDPAMIGLGSVLMTLGEPLFVEPEYCQRHAGTETDGQCVHQSGCTLRGLWHTLEGWIRHTLDQVTLADLLESEQHLTGLLQDRLAHALFEPPTSLPLLTTVARS